MQKKTAVKKTPVKKTVAKKVTPNKTVAKKVAPKSAAKKAATKKATPTKLASGKKIPKTYKGKSTAPGGGGRFAMAVDAMTGSGLPIAEAKAVAAKQRASKNKK